jgi:predicted nucleic acid-binding protein
VAERVAFDTTFLIDLQRERGAWHRDREQARGAAPRERTLGDVPGPAHRFLAAAPDRELYLSATVLGEFAEGFDDPEHPALRAVRNQHLLLPIDELTALAYGRIARALRLAGQMIGTTDLWIAATSTRYALPLVTANTAQFARVPGLELIPYR